MIQVDKEINFKISRLKIDLRSTNRQITFFYIIHKFIWVIFFIYIFVVPKGLHEYIENVNLFIFFDIILMILTAIIFFCCYGYIEDMIIKLCDKRESLEKEIKDEEDFNVYLIAYRKIEAYNVGKTIYPEIYFSDAKSIVKEFKPIFEEKRIEYEKQHVGRLELNKYLLDEKLANAPIDTYPIQEQELLIKRKKDLEQKHTLS